MTDTMKNNTVQSRTGVSIGWRKRALRLTIAVLIIVFGVAVAVYLKKTAPKATKRPPEKTAPLVRTILPEPTRYTVTVSAMGTVVPAHRVFLKSRVAGEVLSTHPEFVEGGFIKKGATVIDLDDADYRLALAQKKSVLADSWYALKLELGKQEVAKREWRLLNENIPRSDAESELALRKPHLDKAKADVEAAEAAVEKATLDLNRTRILSPMNAMVLSKSVDIGSQVSPQEALAVLIGTDAYWVKASIPLDRLAWITIPRFAGNNGSGVSVHYGNGQTLPGTVIRLMGDIGTEERMANVLIEVKDPLSLTEKNKDRRPLLIGDYVRLDIEGRMLESVFVIPRTALRDNHSIWLATSDGILDIRTVVPVWKDQNSVVLRDRIPDGSRLVISDLPAPVAGMSLRIDPSESSTQRKTIPSNE